MPISPDIRCDYLFVVPNVGGGTLYRCEARSITGFCPPGATEYINNAPVCGDGRIKLADPSQCQREFNLRQALGVLGDGGEQ